MKIDERAVLIRLGPGWTATTSDPEPYEKTRKWWRMAANRDPDVAYAVHRGRVLAVYRTHGWERNPQSGRRAFHGERDEELTRRYAGADVTEYFPRGLEFLLSRNRLNVAVSRARCLAYLVCSPRLLEVNARTIEQMRLANALCRFVELAEPAAASTVSA